MATIKLTIEIPNWSAYQLKKAVVDIDALDDEVGIAIENVQASDILEYIFRGEIGIVEDKWSDLFLNGATLMKYIINEVFDKPEFDINDF